MSARWERTSIDRVAQRERTQPDHVLKQQEVMNQHWPSHPSDFTDHEPGIPVRVRLVWQRDGEEYVKGLARRWDASHVYVQIRDTTGRLTGNGVWVKPIDVYRTV